MSQRSLAALIFILICILRIATGCGGNDEGGETCDVLAAQFAEQTGRDYSDTC